MRRIALAVLLCSAAWSAHADDVLGPAEYLKILSDSKFRYTVLAEPAKNPVAEMRCDRRDARTRVVAKGDEKKFVAWAIKPAALQLINEGETLFQAEKYAEAGQKFKQAAEADPEAAAAHFSYGDALLFGPKDAAGALAQYQKGIALDPTLPIGHFFASTAYVHLARKADAREAIIKALTLHPAYEAVWTIATKNPGFWGAKPVVRHRFAPPSGYLGKRKNNTVEIFAGADNKWLGYAMCKAVWANEKAFEKRRSTENSSSVEEERACVLTQVMAAYNAADSKPEAMPPLERHIFEVFQAQLLDGYILFEIIGQRCPMSLSLLGDDSLAQIEKYVRRYIVIPAE